MKVKLKNLKLDPELIEMRPVNEVIANRYRQAMRNGDAFPKMLVDQHNHIIGGAHRYTGMRAEYGEEYTVDVERRTFRSEADRIEAAIEDNARHGSPLDGITRKRAVLKLTEHGRDPEAIARVMGISPKRVEDMAGLSVVVVGSDKSTRNQPLKRGLEHLSGRRVTEKQYTEHARRDRGVPARQQAEQLTRWLANGWVDLTDEPTASALTELREVLAAKV